MTIPSGPSVAMNANASGMPPKFAATPENVVSAERTQRGVPSRIAAYAMKRPTTPPSSAVTRLISMLVLYASMYGWWKSSRMFVERVAAVLALERADQHRPGGQEQERDRVGEERAACRATRERGASGRTRCPAGAPQVLLQPRWPATRPSTASRVAIFAFACGLLADARELRLRVERGRRQRVQQRLRQHLALGEVVEPRRMREALQVEDLPLVGVDELLPEPRRPRMRRGRVDRLRVVAAVDAVARDR